MAKCWKFNLWVQYIYVAHVLSAAAKESHMTTSTITKDLVIVALLSVSDVAHVRSSKVKSQSSLEKFNNSFQRYSMKLNPREKNNSHEHMQE